MNAAEMPHSLEAEYSVLGGLLIDNSAFDLVTPLLEEADFYHAANRLWYKHLVELHETGEPLDPVTIKERLQQAGDLEKAGGIGRLAMLYDYVVSAANITHHAKIVRDRAHCRQLVRLAQDLDSLARSGAPALEVQDKAEGMIMAAAEREVVDDMAPIKRVLLNVMVELENPSPGVLSGFKDFDNMTNGFRAGDLVYVAARPSMGKTAFAVQLATNIAHKYRKAVPFFTLEMTQEGIVERALFTEARVNANEFKKDPKDHEFARVAQASGLLNVLPLHFDERAKNIRDMRRQCRRLRQRHGELGAIVVDYVQLMHGEGDNRTHELEAISRGLKELAKEFKCPMIALAQLSREVERRPDKRPMLSDLRDSGSLEQDADLVCFLYRPEYYFGPIDKEGNSVEGLAEVIIAKQRNGATGPVAMHFHKEFTRFEDRAPSWRERAA